MATSDQPRPQKSYIRLDRNASDEERVVEIEEWLEEVLGRPADEPPVHS
jgi:hypothetical protein